MVESRAKRKIANAKATVRAYESLFSKQTVVIPKGTRLQQIPSLVYGSADRQGVHLKGNLVDIIRIVRSHGTNLSKNGVTVRAVKFEFTRSGLMSLAS